MISYKSPSCRNEPCPSPGISGFERPGTVLRGTSQCLQGRREHMVPAAWLQPGWVSCLCHLEGRHKTREGTAGSSDGDCPSKHDDTPQNQGRGSRVPTRHAAAASLTIAAFGRASPSLTKSEGNKPTQKSAPVPSGELAHRTQAETCTQSTVGTAGLCFPGPVPKQAPGPARHQGVGHAANPSRTLSRGAAPPNPCLLLPLPARHGATGGCCSPGS